MGADAIGNASVAVGTWNDLNGDNGIIFDVDTDGDGIADASSELTRAVGDRTTAIGPAAWAVADDSIAIGSGSIADRTNTLSVGAVGAERQIANVAAGTQSTDAVNVAQMQAGDAATLSAAKLYTDERIGEIASFDTRRVDRLEAQFGTLDRRLNRVGALSAALSLAVPDGRVGGANQFSMSVGQYRDQQALSVGYSRLIAPRAAIRISAAVAGSESAAGVGFNVGW